MGATWISWRMTATVIMTILQIQALISVKTKAVTGVEGQTFNFSCEYPADRQNNTKYFRTVSSDHLIRTDRHNQWVRDGRFSLYDNTTGAFLIVKVDKLMSEDSGAYWCGVNSPEPDYISVIQLNVSRDFPVILSSPFPKDHTVDRLNLPLYLTAVMCVAAILTVCLFTICLLLAVKQRQSDPRHNRETSSDYETMMPSVRAEPDRAPDCAAPSALPPPPPDLCSHFTSKHRESTATLGLGEYVDVDVPGHVCQYQHLDLSRFEDHVYHSLHGNSGPKDGPLGVKEYIVEKVSV